MALQPCQPELTRSRNSRPYSSLSALSRIFPFSLRCILTFPQAVPWRIPYRFLAGSIDRAISQSGGQSFRPQPPFQSRPPLPQASSNIDLVRACLPSCILRSGRSLVLKNSFFVVCVWTGPIIDTNSPSRSVKRPRATGSRECHSRASL